MGATEYADDFTAAASKPHTPAPKPVDEVEPEVVTTEPAPGDHNAAAESDGSSEEGIGRSFLNSGFWEVLNNPWLQAVAGVGLCVFTAGLCLAAGLVIGAVSTLDAFANANDWRDLREGEARLSSGQALTVGAISLGTAFVPVPEGSLANGLARTPLPEHLDAARAMMFLDPEKFATPEGAAGMDAFLKGSVNFVRGQQMRDAGQIVGVTLGSQQTTEFVKGGE